MNTSIEQSDDDALGVIGNRERASQIRDFSGLKFGTSTPTDIDGFLEFKDKLYVFIEAKVEHTEIKDGQLLAYERLCDAIAAAGKSAVVLIIKHNTPVGQDVDFAQAIVERYRYNMCWKTPPSEITCRQAIVKFLKIAGLDYLTKD